MSHKYKLGTKVRILWTRANYVIISGYTNIGEVAGYRTLSDGTILVKLCNFYKHNKHHTLHFPVDSLRPLEVDVKDGDTL